MSSETKSVTIRCLCGEHQFVYDVPVPDKPLDVFACHCNSCRHAGGGVLFQGAVPWTYPPIKSSGISPASRTPNDEQSSREDDNSTTLVRYAFGPILTYWFCRTCSTKMFWRYNAVGSPLEIFQGLVPEDSWLVQRNLLKYSIHVHIHDTLDGGASKFLTGVTRCAAGLEKSRETQASVVDKLWGSEFVPPSSEGGVDDDGLQMYCHCRSVEFRLPTKCRREVIIGTSEDLRRFTSVEVSFWSEVDQGSISWKSSQFDEVLRQIIGEANIVNDGAIGHLRMNMRAYIFCRVCSAALFYKDDSEHVLKVGIGLLNPRYGARGEGVWDWDNASNVTFEGRGVAISHQTVSEPSELKHEVTRI